MELTEFNFEDGIIVECNSFAENMVADILEFGKECKLTKEIALITCFTIHKELYPNESPKKELCIKLVIAKLLALINSSQSIP